MPNLSKTQIEEKLWWMDAVEEMQLANKILDEEGFGHDCRIILGRIIQEASRRARIECLEEVVKIVMEEENAFDHEASVHDRAHELILSRLDILIQQEKKD